MLPPVVRAQTHIIAYRRMYMSAHADALACAHYHAGHSARLHVTNAVRCVCFEPEEVVGGREAGREGRRGEKGPRWKKRTGGKEGKEMEEAGGGKEEETDSLRSLSCPLPPVSVRLSSVPLPFPAGHGGPDGPLCVGNSQGQAARTA